MFGKVQEVGTTQKGGPKIKISGVWVYAAPQLDVSGLVVGREVEYWTKTFGKDNNLLGLEAWLPFQAGPQTAVATSGAPLHPAPSAPREPIGTPSELTEAELRFVSNVVGSAIMSGAIKEPTAIASWFLMARVAVTKKYFDDDSQIP